MAGMLVSFCLRENTSAQVAALSPLHTKTHTGQGGRVKSAKSAADYWKRRLWLSDTFRSRSGQQLSW